MSKKTKEDIEDERRQFELILSQNQYFLGTLTTAQVFTVPSNNYPLSEAFIGQDTQIPAVVEETTRLIVQEQSNWLQRSFGVPDIIEAIIYARTGSYSERFAT